MNKTKKKQTSSNKVVMGIVAFMLMFTFTATSGVAKAEANTGDVAWSFNLSINNSSYQYTSPGDKNTNTKMYLNWQQAVYQIDAIYVSPFAVSGSTHIAAGTSGMGLVNFYMSNEGQYRVTNYVYENGYTSAALGMMGASGYGTALGQWSPDTYTNYPVLK